MVHIVLMRHPSQYHIVGVSHRQEMLESLGRVRNFPGIEMGDRRMRTKQLNRYPVVNEICKILDTRPFSK